MDKQVSLANKAQKVIIKWLFIITVGIFAFGVGINQGYQKYLVNQLQATKSESKTLPSGSLSNQNNTDNQMSPTKPH